MDLLSTSLIMASHFPLAHSDLLHHYPDHHHVIHLDMDHTTHPDFASSKHQHQHQQLAPSAAEYSSPSLDSQTDDDLADRVFDVDVDYIQSHPPQQPHHLSYDPSGSPSWASMATPGAWEGEPQKLPSLDPESRRGPFSAYATTDPSVAQHSPTTAHLYSTLADYLDESATASSTAATHSPPTAYMNTPASLGVMDYYTPSSPYRYGSSLQHNPSCDPRFVSPAPTTAGPSSSPQHQDVGISFADVYTDPMQTQTQIESHTVKVESDVPMPPYDSDSGEDEKSESDDPSYVVSGCSTRSRSVGSAIAAPRPMRTPAPEPVPNLTKKSRGRRVPTAAALYGSSSAFTSGGKNARTYVCKVRDCGKCFARSEHLKRHVRSIHTNEKPHRCPHPGCNKEFSRHDNLCQHMRVHRNYSAPKDGTFGTF